MAINNYFENTDINIYFHMKNHYRRLKSARSTIDNSFPPSCIQSISSAVSAPGSARSLNNIILKERHIRSYQQENIKKHNCISSGSGNSETSLNTVNIQSRNKTKRSAFAVTSKMQYIPKPEGSRSTGRRSLCPEFNKTKKKEKLIKKAANCKLNNKLETIMVDQHLLNHEINKIDNYESILPIKTEEKINKQSKVREHEYLQFLLRITEDIIMNNLYTNEDIENVFRTHIDANKNHLDVNKMEGQLTRLCMELGIPYKYHDNTVVELECIDNLFAPYSCDNDQNLEDCECTTKRTLNMGVRKDEEVSVEENKVNDTKSYLNKMFNVLASRCSESQISTGLPHCNSLSSSVGCIQQISELNLSSSENNIFKSIEKLQITGECSKDKFLHNDFAFSTEEKSSHKDCNLTPKEKLGCVEEDILYNKYKNSIEIEAVQNDPINECENPEYIVSDSEKELNNVDKSENTENNTNVSNNKKLEDSCMSQNNPTPTTLCGETERTLGIEYKFKYDLTNVENIKKKLPQSRTENTENGNCNNLSLIKYDGTNCNKNSTMPIKDHIPCDSSEKTVNESITSLKNETKSTSDQCVQIEVMQSDKECNTNVILDEYTESDYVLLNGPIYILRTVLNSENKFIIYDKDKIDKKVPEYEIMPEKLSEDNIIQHCDSIPVYQTQVKLASSSEDDFLKLLNSDYDLMPQRDSDSSNKYHHLLVDATTSISNLNINKSVSSTLTNPDALLLTDKYELSCQTTESPIFEVDNPSKYAFKKDEFEIEKRLSGTSLVKVKNYSFLKRISASQHGLKYSIQKESMPFDGKIPSLDLSLTNHELLSMSILKGGEHISKDVSESGEIVGSGMCTDDEESTSTSDIHKNCSTSSSNRTHVLGKRKLEHPT